MSARSKLIMSVLVLVVVGLGSLLGFESFGGSDTQSTTTASPSSSSTAVAETVAPRGVTAVPIPQQAFDTLQEIDNGGWPDSANAPGTKGGLTWQNRGGDLAKTTADGTRITYQEWDVNPKERGQGRDAERIVTGSDGSAWYTGDHYTSFIKMR
ncbi:ribonuclease domain-containing protein [Tomitella biformata]|uniref:ribonuclease domain-containing protein n=1 Tax=Tomitella biformata TaxID=630403 RepID=UPI0004667061|nr:ribonuclease domain-containing protein [Tomitella biformata]